MTKSNKITIILFSILFAFVAFFGIFIATNKDSVVKADSDITFTSYSYQSGSLPFYLGTYTQNSVTNTNHYNSRWFNFSWSGSSPNGNLDFTFNGGVAYTTRNVSYTLLFGDIVFDTWKYISIRKNYNLIGDGTTQSYLNFQYYYTTGFNFNIISLRIYSERWGGTNTSVITTRLIYTDVNNKTLTFIFFTYGDAQSSYYSDIVYSDRIYFLSSSLSDNQYYQAGLQQGLADNQSNIYNDGYNQAIVDNKANWEQTGYNRGIQDANDYTFLGLIGAIIDAPISALFGYIDTDRSSPTYNQRVGGFFNFELLGVNLKDFFFAVLTFAVVIVIVRFALGK